MHYSGILVTVSPERVPACVHDLETLPGIEVYHRDPAHGRLVVVQETPSIETQETGFRRIGSLPHVLSVELVYHYQDGDPGAVSPEEAGFPGGAKG